MRIFILLLFIALPAQAQDSGPIIVLERRELPIERTITAPTHSLSLALAHLVGGGWAPEAIHDAVRQSACILEQCSVALRKLEIVLVSAPERFRDFYTPTSRELARALLLGKPTIYFVSGTHQRPAFDAEAIGRGNSRSRPELRDTVWVTRGTRDLGIAVTHELVHVLMDSGEHTQAPGNLMREDTTPENSSLTEAQCARLRDTGAANGLLTPWH